MKTSSSRRSRPLQATKEGFRFDADPSLKARGDVRPAVHPIRRLLVFPPNHQQARSTEMADISQVKEHMEVVGADGAHVGTVDKVVGTRIKLTRPDSGSHSGHHHYVPEGLIAAIEGDTVRLSANGANAALLEEEGDGSALGEQSLFSWRNIGIGAAAAAVAVGAAAFTWGRRGSEE